MTEGREVREADLHTPCMVCVLQQTTGKKECSKTCWVPSCAGDCCSCHLVRDTRILVHGDDFVVEGQLSDLDWVRDMLAAKHLLKSEMDQSRATKSVSSSWGGVVDCRADELWWKAGPRREEKILEACGMDSREPFDHTRNQIAGTWWRSTACRTGSGEVQIRRGDDVRFAVKEVCRDMAKPTCGSWR